MERGRSAAERVPKPPATLMEGATLISQGAEARVYRVPLSSPTAATAATAAVAAATMIVKERFPKSYRHAALDRRLTAQRIRAEVRAAARAAGAGVRVARTLYVDKGAGRIVMEDLGAETAKARLWADGGACGSGRYGAASETLCREIGRVVALLHGADIVHGDLTTSNFVVVGGGGGDAADADAAQLAPIDFGLSFVSGSLEDKAVDLYVLERAFLCTHLRSEALVQTVLDAYAATYARGPQVISRLDQVRARGRKKLAFG